MKKAIFSVLIGDYDLLNKAPKFTDWDAVLFTDKMPEDSKGWKIRIIKPELSNAKESRRYKLLSHIYLSEYDLVCYVDANMILLREPPKVPVWFPHPTRKTVVQEAAKLIEIGHDSKSVTDQVNSYFQVKFSDKVGLFQNGYFIRRHSMAMNVLMEKTFSIVEKYTHRDQLALPFACFLLSYKPEGLQYRNSIRNYVRLVRHLSPVKVGNKIQVHHITSARSDKNFGLAINQAIEGLPENDWICLRDIDTVPPYHEEFIKQCEEIANSNCGFSLIGCMTNRLGLKYQLVPGMFDEWDMKKHRLKAKELSKIKTIKRLTGSQTVGGIMMLFPKSVWRKVGKFPEGGISIKNNFVDYHFSRAVGKVGKLGIAENIYLFHMYRSDAKDTRTHKDHLK